MEYLKNKYSEVELIKKNNWADIYVAINNETHEKVQLKVLKNQRENTKYINSITYEIDQLQNLKHKNLIGINGVDKFIENNTTYYYVETEYFKGKTLSDKMILKSHTCKESLEIIKQVAEGLNEFHYRGLNYETLSAENIFINSQGIVKVDVLSYIKQRYDETEEYDSYDEFEDGIDKDIYALGIILYQLITRDSDFKLRKLKKNIEDDEVYSMLYALTSKNTKYRYENLNVFLSDVNEHLQYLSFDGNQDIDKCESEIEDEYEYEDDYEGNKSVLIKRLCACVAVVLVAFGGIKVMGLVKKDNDKNETTIEMAIEKESTDTEDLAEESEEDQSDESQVESTDNTTISNTTANTNNTYKENTNTVQNPNNGSTNNNTNTNNNSSGNSTSGSQGTVGSGSGSTTTKPGTGNTSSGSGSTTTKPGTGNTSSGSGSTTTKPGTGSTGSGSGSTTTKPGTGSTGSGSGSTTTKPGTGSTDSESGSGNQGTTGSTGSESGSGNQGTTGSTGSESESGNQDTGSTGSENGSQSQGTEGIQIESETVETQSLEQYQIIE